MEFREPTKLHRKSGVGHPRLVTGVEPKSISLAGLWMIADGKNITIRILEPRHPVS
jgi:hypothetical protein